VQQDLLRSEQQLHGMTHLFDSGDLVEATVRDSGRWFLGKILHVFADNSYSVLYTANRLSPERVPALRIRLAATSAASAVPTAAAAAASATAPARTVALTEAERAEHAAKAARLAAERLEREGATRLQQTVTRALQKLAQHGRARDVEGIISVLTTVPDTAQSSVNAALVIALGDLAAGLVCKPSSTPAEQCTAVVSARAAHASTSRQASSLFTGLQCIANRDVVKAHECITASLAADSTELSDYAAAVCDLYTGSGSVSEIDAILKQLQHADTCQSAVTTSSGSGNQSASSTDGNSAATADSAAAAAAAAASGSDSTGTTSSNRVQSPLELFAHAAVLSVVSREKLKACICALKFLLLPDAVRQSQLPDEFWTKQAVHIAAETCTVCASAIAHGQFRTFRSNSTDSASNNSVKVSPELDAEMQEWEQLKAGDGIKSKTMERLMQMAGMQSIKQRFLNICQRLIVDRQRQWVDTSHDQLFNVRFEGNPGTCLTIHDYIQFN
jgi:hypothetical protein